MIKIHYMSFSKINISCKISITKGKHIFPTLIPVFHMQTLMAYNQFISYNITNFHHLLPKFKIHKIFMQT